MAVRIRDLCNWQMVQCLSSYCNWNSKELNWFYLRNLLPPISLVPWGWFSIVVYEENFSRVQNLTLFLLQLLTLAQQCNSASLRYKAIFLLPRKMGFPSLPPPWWEEMQLLPTPCHTTNHHWTLQSFTGRGFPSLLPLQSEKCSSPPTPMPHTTCHNCHWKMCP